MGLISWFINNNYEKANSIILLVDIIAVVIISVFIVLLNKIGMKKIKDLEDIK